MKKLLTFIPLLLVLLVALPQAAEAIYTTQADCTTNCPGGTCTYIPKNGIYECSLPVVNSAPGTDEATCEKTCATSCNLIPAVPNKSAAYYQCPASTAPVSLGTCSGTTQGNYTCTLAGNNTTFPTDGGCTGSNGGHALTCSSVPSGYTKLSDATNGSNTTTPAPGTVNLSTGTFKALAPIPGLTDTPTNNLTAFFNNLYKFCIGIAAVLAILEITMGGFQVMSGDSITAHSAGRDRIVGAILGLVLVLSPFLVFSIINPSILSFGVFSGDLTKLQPGSTSSGTAPATPAPAATNDTSGTTTQSF